MPQQIPAGIDPRFNSAVAQYVEGGKTSAKPRAQLLDWRPRVACDHVIMSRYAHTANKVSKCSRDAILPLSHHHHFSFIMQAQATKPQEVRKY
jgi:hypothetical protein